MCIYGPTASGKSALASLVAEKCDGVIINADSMQVYANLRVLTARPTTAEEAAHPHVLYGHVDGATPYNMATWAVEALQAIELVLVRGQVPILVGGTGLYFKTLFEGISPIPTVAKDVRAHWRHVAATQTADYLHAQLLACDPTTAATLRPTDTQRLTRALEVFHSTGQGLAQWANAPQTPFYAVEHAACFALHPNRAWVYERINTRFDQMMNEGAMDEVHALMAQNIPADSPMMRAHGVPEFIAYLRGEMTYGDALTQAKANVRHYAKRQFTWMRGQLVGWQQLYLP